MKWPQQCLAHTRFTEDISSSPAEGVRTDISYSGQMSGEVIKHIPVSQKLTVFLNRATSEKGKEEERCVFALQLSVALPALGICSIFKQI